MDFFTKPFPPRLKQIVAIGALLFALLGLPALFGFVCLTLISVIDGSPEAIGIGLITFPLTVVTLGAGGLIFWHSLRSIRNINSTLFRLPSTKNLAGVFGLCLIGGYIVTRGNIAIGLLFPPWLLLMAVLPPLGAIAWFTSTPGSPKLSWRRAIVAFTGGVTISTIAAIILETLFLMLLFALVAGLATPAIDGIEALTSAFQGDLVPKPFVQQGFFNLFVYIIIAAPIIETLIKPLVVIPFVSRLSSRKTFLMGAIAGAGFAAIETIVLASLGFLFWPTLLIVRALGGAIHPLSSGLTALGWRALLTRRPQARFRWFLYFSIGAGLHSFWNASSLLVITLLRVELLSSSSPAINLLGIVAGGTTGLLLILVGGLAGQTGRWIIQNNQHFEKITSKSILFDFTFSEKAIAIWTVISLIVVAPIGLATLPFWFGP